MMHYAVLTSGSCGNCYAFYDGEETILIDCGLTFTGLKKRLDNHSIPVESITGMLLTHLHPDHSKGVGVFQRKLGKPCYMSKFSFENQDSVIVKQKIEKSLVETFENGDEFDIGHFHITSFATSHDSAGSSGYMITNGGVSYFVMTDTGRIPEAAGKLADMSVVKFIESNYDEEMLSSGPYPERLRARIRGPYGHLSNDDAAEFAVAHSKQGDHLYFVHVSDNNNTLEKVEEIMKRRIPSGIFVKACDRGASYEGFIDE